MQHPPQAIPASYLILRRGETVLLLLRQNTGYYDGWFGLPAGHLEVGELPVECLVREIKEKIGLDLERGAARLVHTMYRTKCDESGDRADYFFEVEHWSGEPRNMEPHKCVELRWFPVNALPKNTVPTAREALEAIEKHLPYSEFGLDRVMRDSQRPVSPVYSG